MPEAGDPFRMPPRGGGDGPEAEEEAAHAAHAWRALREGLDAAAAGGHGGELRCVELCPICRAADLLRATGPPELRGQINDFQRETLLTLRALLDHYLERLDAPAPAGSRVEDIPIE